MKRKFISISTIAIGVIVFLKFTIPLVILFFPFLGGWANFILDVLDGDLLIPLGLSDPTYQTIDKSADWITYVGMVFAVYRFRWKVQKWIYVLFGLRTIGQIAFFILRDERIFFLFPNFLEPFFLIYATITVFKKAKAYDYYLRHKVAIWVFVILYKLQDEWITHIGNIDRSDIIKKLFGD